MLFFILIECVKTDTCPMCIYIGESITKKVASKNVQGKKTVSGK